MPAHRSDAEAEIRDAVVAKLRRCRPNARIIHEINLLDGMVRADVMAVSRAEIITVEIKSERDKLDRLPDQLDAMRRCSHIAIAALHRKFIPEEIVHLRSPRLDCVPWHVTTWWYPAAQDMAEAHHPAFQWTEPDLSRSLNQPLPPDAMSLLWRDELEELCQTLGLTIPRRANMRAMTQALRWAATGRDLTLGICAALRKRDRCAEADPVTEAD